VEKRKHDCSHEYCDITCPKKKTEPTLGLSEMLPPNLGFLLNQANNPLKKKILIGGKSVIFGLKPKEDTNTNSNVSFNNINSEIEGSVEKKNSNLNNIFSTVGTPFQYVKNSIFNSNQVTFISNTHLPTTNLFKSVQVPQIEQNKNSNHIPSVINTEQINNLQNNQEKINPNNTEKIQLLEKSVVNNNSDKKFFFMVKK